MFIYHFNRLIRNRWLWGFFAIIIVFAFVVQDMITSKADRTSGGAGTLGGKEINQEKFDFMASAVRGFGSRNPAAFSERDVNRMVWERFAAAQTAEALGIEATGAIVRRELAAPFTQNGVYDHAAYLRALQMQGIESRDLERQVREEFPYHVMRNVLLQSAVWAAPMEVDAELQASLDRITATTLTFTDPKADAPLALTEEELRAYYTEHIKTFEVPDRVVVRYIAMPLTNFYAQVDASEDEIVRYFEDFEDKYVREGTNGTPERLTFDEAKEQVRLDLIKDGAPDVAKKFLIASAADTVIKSGFDALGTQLGLPVNTTEAFSFDAPPVGIENASAFAEAAFETDLAQPITRLASSSGDSLVYFMELVSVDPRHTPAFEAVRESVKSRAEAESRAKTFTAYAENVAAELGKVVPETPWETAAKAFALSGMNVSTSLTFVVSDLLSFPDYPNARETIFTAMQQPEGTVSEPVPLADGSMLLVFVEKREPGDARRAEMMRSQTRSQIVQARASSVVDGWMAWNLDRVGLTDVKNSSKIDPIIAAPEADDEDE